MQSATDLGKLDDLIGAVDVLATRTSHTLWIGYAGSEENMTDMGECKHGLRLGCVYCHGRTTDVAGRPGQKKRSGVSRLSEKMNDRMTALKRRLRELRGE